MPAVLFASLVLSITPVIGGLFILIRSQRKIENILFFVICLLSSLWGITFANIETFDSLTVARFLNAASYVLGALLMLAVTAFTYYFPVHRKVQSLIYYSAVLIPIALLSATPLIAGEV